MMPLKLTRKFGSKRRRKPGAIQCEHVVDSTGNMCRLPASEQVGKNYLWYCRRHAQVHRPPNTGELWRTIESTITTEQHR